jgi:hypothetical protein
VGSKTKVMEKYLIKTLVIFFKVTWIIHSFVSKTIDRFFLPKILQLEMWVHGLC